MLYLSVFLFLVFVIYCLNSLFTCVFISVLGLCWFVVRLLVAYLVVVALSVCYGVYFDFVHAFWLFVFFIGLFVL